MPVILIAYYRSITFNSSSVLAEISGRRNTLVLF